MGLEKQAARKSQSRRLVAALGRNDKESAFLIRRFFVSFAFRALGRVLRKKTLLLLNCAE